jgi:hypothetical protein
VRVRVGVHPGAAQARFPGGARVTLDARSFPRETKLRTVSARNKYNILDASPERHRNIGFAEFPEGCDNTRVSVSRG